MKFKLISTELQELAAKQGTKINGKLQNIIVPSFHSNFQDSLFNGMSMQERQKALERIRVNGSLSTGIMELLKGSFNINSSNGLGKIPQLDIKNALSSKINKPEDDWRSPLYFTTAIINHGKTPDVNWNILDEIDRTINIKIK